MDNKIDETRGVVERRDSEVFVSAAAVIKGGSNWDTIRKIIDQIVKLIAFYEQKEATTLYELALWKVNLEQAEEVADINRDASQQIPAILHRSLSSDLCHMNLQDFYTDPIGHFGLVCRYPHRSLLFLCAPSTKRL